MTTSDALLRALVRALARDSVLGGVLARVNWAEAKVTPADFEKWRSQVFGKETEG
jgi:hypothetical protein